MGATELEVIGLTCNLVGVFFLANSIIFRKLRKVIQEFFGVRSRSIRAIKDYTLNNIQVALGFLFLTMGFLLVIVAKLNGGLAESWPVVWTCVGILALAFALYMVGAVYSRRSFKKYMRQFFVDHPEAFNREPAMTKDIGEFLGIPHNQDMTVEDYTEKVRQVLELKKLGSSNSQQAERRRERGLARGRA